MSQQIESFRLSNGLTVLIEKMPDVQSAAMTLLIPSGCVRDLPGKCGTASILTEMFPRGAGGYSARDYCSRLDNLGLQRNISVGTSHITFTAATTADRLCESLREFSRMILTPHLSDDDFEPARDLVAQSLTAMEDEPRQRLGKALRQHSFPSPWGNSAEGELSDLPQISIQDIRRHFDGLIRPNEAILGIAGNVDSVEVCRTISMIFDDWSPGELPSVVNGSRPDPFYHMTHDSTQTHIGLSWSSVPYHDARYYEAWAAVSLLSGGSSSRLFTEVREKRGLCYAISASLNTLKEEGRVFAYAGTTNERAQETLDVMVAEILRLHEGITDDELQRCKARAKSALIMQQESTTARASSMARDHYHLGRVVTLDEVNARIDGLTVKGVRDFAAEFAPREMVLVTIGPQAPDTTCVRSLGG